MRSDRFFTRLDIHGGFDRIAISSPSSSHWAQMIDQANTSARDLARKRLSGRIPLSAVDALPRYFDDPTVHEAASCHQSDKDRWTTKRLVQTICEQPQTLVIGKKARGLQIGISGTHLTEKFMQFGMQVEPDSDVFLLDPTSIIFAAMNNASVEIRLFDRHNAEWASVADDIIAVSGADVFFKLFIAGGEVSVNGWHRDASDVLVMLLDGTKLFEVATTDSSDERPLTTVSTVMRPGSTLLLPRGRLHKATPTGELSSLLSIGLMRCGDWFYRGASPTHLGLMIPRAPLLYRLMLHPRTRPTWESTCSGPRVVYWSRTPGGIGLIASGEAGLRFLASGNVWAADTDAFELLAMIHGADGVNGYELARATGRREEWCVTVAEEAVEAGLVYKKIDLAE
jgi:hypothetical protein